MNTASRLKAHIAALMLSAVTIAAAGGVSPASADDKTDALLARLEKLEAEVARLRKEVKKSEQKAEVQAAEAKTNRAKLDALAASAASAPSGAAAGVMSAANGASWREPAPKSRFEGFYAASFMGWMGTMRTAEDSGAYTDAGAYNFKFSKLKGPQYGFAAGYNAVTGNLLVGFEAAGIYDTAHATGSSGGPAPSSVLGLYSYTPLNGAVIPEITRDAGSSRQARISRGASGELVGRVGVLATEDLLVYARVGGGATRFESRTTTTNYKVTCRNATTFDYYGSPRGYYQYLNTQVTGCGSTTVDVSDKNTVAHAAIVPYFVLGLGFEKNFGNFFARGEANVSQHLPTANDINLTAQMTNYSMRAGVGYRF